MNLFATIVTYPAPSANYRGESELNRLVIQKITDGRHEYPIFSPESIRNALREILRRYGLPMNRTRLHDEEQLAVKFNAYPDPARFADDFLFGYLVATKDRDAIKTGIILDESDPRGNDLAPELRRLQKELDAAKGDAKKSIKSGLDKVVAKFSGFAFKRDSVLRMNLAKGLEPYRNNAVFTQSPQTKPSEGAPLYQNAGNSALLHRETAVTSFQYPFALAGDDCKPNPDWARALLRAIGELNDVAGNHARSYFEMAPASITVRLTERLVAGYDTYHFRVDGRNPNNERRVTSTLVRDLLDTELNLPGGEFHFGGELVRELPAEVRQSLKDKGVTLDADPRRLLDTVGEKFVGASRTKEG